MSFAEELEALRHNVLQQRKNLLYQRFIHLKRAPRDEVFPEYEKLKDKLIQMVNDNPFATQYTICFGSKMDRAMTLFDLFVEDGITNFAINDDGKLLTRVEVELENHERESIKRFSHYTVTICYPFSQSIFD